MAITVVKTTEGLLKIETFYVESPESNSDILVMTTGVVDETLRPLSETVKHELLISEEEAHKELRTKAEKEKKFVRKLSTNPEWSPSYNEEKK